MAHLYQGQWEHQTRDKDGCVGVWQKSSRQKGSNYFTEITAVCSIELGIENEGSKSEWMTRSSKRFILYLLSIKLDCLSLQYHFLANMLLRGRVRGSTTTSTMGMKISGYDPWEYIIQMSTNVNVKCWEPMIYSMQ